MKCTNIVALNNCVCVRACVFHIFICHYAILWFCQYHSSNAL
jgi:hypothetical protein